VKGGGGVKKRGGGKVEEKRGSVSIKKQGTQGFFGKGFFLSEGGETGVITC